MFKDFMLVGIGSFMGGGSRFLISKMVQSWSFASFPLGTMVVNIIGCFVIGFLSGLPFSGSLMSPSAKIILTTGFCGGFTTFSTFMNESSMLMKNGDFIYMTFYVFGSLAVGLIAVLAGYQLSKVF
jgi:CrcB protein